jgi:hypothetical protein
MSSDTSDVSSQCSGHSGKVCCSFIRTVAFLIFIHTCAAGSNISRIGLHAAMFSCQNSVEMASLEKLLLLFSMLLH